MYLCVLVLGDEAFAGVDVKELGVGDFDLISGGLALKMSLWGWPFARVRVAFWFCSLKCSVFADSCMKCDDKLSQLIIKVLN